MGDMIYAVASGLGPSAIAIVRISGSGTGLVIRAMCGRLPIPRKATVSSFFDGNSGCLIDRGLVLWFPGPNSFTGEDCAEFHVHGGRAVLSQIQKSLAGFSFVRPAQPGEFARRAFVNGKLDLTEVEALADVVDAETEAQLHQALGNAGGALHTKINSWRAILVGALARIAADIDFSDEDDVPSNIDDGFWEPLRCTIEDMKSVLQDGRRGEIVRAGFTVLIAGPPNVGKSSLLNAFARRNVAIVSTQAGTTRDLIEVRLEVEGLPINFVDTAGLRDGAGEIESEGIRRAIARAQTADMILWLDDKGFELAVPKEFGEQENILYVATKIDCKNDRTERGVGVSSLTGVGIQELLASVRAKAENVVRGSPALLTRERHRANLFKAVQSLDNFDRNLNCLELFAEDLRLACRFLEEIIGVVESEAVLGEIFSRFCIGK